ncbi:MAG: DUF5329 family protein [Gammaproteobacteria bacterium]|jgi:hypothetical protein
MKPVIFFLFILILLPGRAGAEAMDDEIDFLINSVGRDGCNLVRNGRKYSGREAREHLRSKRELNAKLFNSTEGFIEIIASKSATSGNPYLIDCRGQPRQTSNAWFWSLLENYREEI